MVSKVAISYCGGALERMCRVRRPTVQRCGARDLKSTASFNECPTNRGVQRSARLCMREDAARTANQCVDCATATIWCKPSSPSTLVDVRSPTPPWKICRAFRARPFRNSAQQCAQFTQDLPDSRYCRLWSSSSGCAWGSRRLALEVVPCPAGKLAPGAG